MTTENYAHLHRAYQMATGRAVVLTMQDHFRWHEFHSRGWTESDLRLVVAFIQRRIRDKRRYPESLRLHNLIDPARFADDLLDAKAEQRRPAPTPRQAVLRAAGRQEQEKDRVVSAGQALERTRLAEQLKAWRESL